MGYDQEREQLILDLKNYQSGYSEEEGFRSRFLELINGVPNCFTRDSLSAHITGSAWIVDDSFKHALMTHHAKLDRWLQLGGHADGEMNILQTALREGQEESGLNSIRVLQTTIFDLDIHEIPERGDVPRHEHFDIRYIFMADKEESIAFNHESNNISWIPMDRLDELTHNNRSILRMAEKCSHIKGKVSPVW